MFHQILVVAQAADHVGSAARVVGETARHMQSGTICLLVSYPGVPGFLGFRETGKATSARLAQAETAAKSLIQAIGPVPAEIQTEFLAGSAAESAIVLSRARHSDLIVLDHGATGLLGRIRRSILRHRVLERAGCPVLIV